MKNVMTKIRVGLCALALMALLVCLFSIKDAHAGNLWELDGSPNQYTGTPGSVVNVEFGVHYIGLGSADFSASGFWVTDTKPWSYGEMTVPTTIPHCEWRTLIVPVLIPQNAKPGEVDTVTVTVPDPVSLSKTIFVEEPAVGGIDVPIDKLALLAPYIGLASTILAATVASTVYVKRVKRRKEKQ